MKIPPPEEFCKLAFLRYLIVEMADMHVDDRNEFFSLYYFLLASQDSDKIYELNLHVNDFGQYFEYQNYEAFKYGMAELLAEQHSGDCTQQPWSCQTCKAEEFFKEFVK